MLNRDRIIIERELDTGMLIKIIENPYVSRNPKVPDYIEKYYYSAEKGQQRADKMKKFKGRYAKICKMNSVVGKGKASLLALTERQSRKALIFKLKRKTQENVIKATESLERKCGEAFKVRCSSITMDNGAEFLDFTGIER